MAPSRRLDRIGAEGGSQEFRRGTRRVLYGPKQFIGGQSGVNLTVKK